MQSHATEDQHPEPPSVALARSPRRMCLIFEPASEHGLLDFPEVIIVTDERQRDACTVFFDSLFSDTRKGTGEEGFRSIVLSFDLTGTELQDLQLPPTVFLDKHLGMCAAMLIAAQVGTGTQEEESNV